MPLLKRQPFRKQKPPQDVDPDEELFFCKVTNEVFQDYEEFFERVILCNSLVWTCELTGRPGLTYVEAQESEERARNVLVTLPPTLKRCLLCLGMLTRRGRLADMCDDVFNFARDRYFVGEEVELSRDGQKEVGTIVKVYAPPPDGKKNEKSESHGAKGSGSLPSDKKSYGPNPAYYQYDIKVDEEVIRAQASSVTRKKGLLTREKNKLFLKQFFEPKDNVWKLKESLDEKYSISSIKYTDFFAGSLPNFVTTFSKKNSPSSTKMENGHTADSKNAKNAKKDRRGGLPPAKEISIEDVEELRRNLEENRRQREEAKQKLKVEREKERERIREEKRKQAAYLKEWHRPREDLECDDLKDIPLPIPVNCSIPNELFGKAVMILEFVNSFGPMFGLKDVFSHGFTLEHLERSVIDHDIQSPLGDMLQFLLQAIFNLQAGEETVKPSLLNKSETVDINDDVKDSNLAQLLKTAAAVTLWPQRHQGLPLKKLVLDAFTVTEITRLHLLTLGSQAADPLWYQQVRGSDSVWDDPAVELCLNDPVLLRSLATKSVFDLSPGDKLKILEVLIHQLLTFLAVREKVEEALEKLRVARYEMRHLQWAEQRREKEAASLRKLKTLNAAKSNGEDEDHVNEDYAANRDDVNEKVKSKSDVNYQKKRDSYLKKEQELYETISKLQTGCCLQPLGRDRSFRRFWVFNSIPGLFVEDDDTFADNLRQPPRTLNGSFIVHSNDADHKSEKKSEKSISDKENKVLDFQPPFYVNSCNKQHKLLSENHPVITGKKAMNFIAKSEEPLAAEKPPISALNGTDAQVRWAFYHTCNAVDELVNALNPRGFREGPLREILIHDRSNIVKDFCSCPVHWLNPNAANLIEFQETRKSSRLAATLSVLASEPNAAEEAMEVTLREMILDIEERLYAGSLGTLKVTDRLNWRNTIQNRGYEKYCDELAWGRQQQDKKPSCKTENERCVTSSATEPGLERLVPPVSVKQMVNELASALLQVAQGIEHKYIKRPLGEDDDERRQRLKLLEELEEKFIRNKNDNVQDSDADKKLYQKHSNTNCTLERWEESLMMCTSFSQIFLHLSTLEVSIAWSKSALNARCRICRRRGDAENMLLCDECNRGHHTYCLKPPLKTIPEGDWFCKDCKPREHLKPSRTAFRPNEEDEHEDSKGRKKVDDNNDENDGDDSDKEMEEDENDVTNHENEADDELSSEEDDAGDKNDTEEDDDNDTDDQDFANDDLCDVCERGGHLICCDSCPLSFHLECADPPLKRVPRGKWECHHCTFKAADLKSRKRGSPTEVNESPAKRTRSKVKPTSEEEDEIWMSGRKRQGPPHRRGASRDVPVDYKLCDQILLALARHECSWPFMRPVKDKEAPHYYEIIKRPVDLATMRKKLSNMEYRTTKDFLADVLLVMQNCIMYNATDSVEYSAALRLSDYFEELVRELGYFEFDGLLHRCKINGGDATPPSPLSTSSPLGKQALR